MAAFTATMLALAVGGAALNAVGSIKAGNAAKRAGQAQQDAANDAGDLADYNAQVADLQAQDAIARGADEEHRFRTRVRGAIGAQRAGFAASNIDVGYGSAVDVQADAAYLGELDALTIKTNAAREAWGYEVQGEDLRRRGQIARKEGKYALESGKAYQTASRYQAAGSILGTGASLLEARYGGRK